MHAADDPRHGWLHGVVVHAFLPDGPDDEPDQEGFQNQDSRNDAQVSQIKDHAGVAVG
jgi:hypothetical protein